MDTASEPRTPEPKQAALGIVVGRDLMFTASVTGTADALGYRMRVAGDAEKVRAQFRRSWHEATERLDRWRPVSTT